MNKWKKIGYVSVELVITAALILSVGFFALLSFGTTGTSLVNKGLSGLDALGVFGEKATGAEVVYDSNGYPDSLNIKPADINPIDDFTFVYDDALSGWVIVKYNNTSDYDVVIPQKHSDGRPIVKLGNINNEGSIEGAFEGVYLNSVAIPKGIIIIGEETFSGNSFPSVIIPNTVTTIENGAFSYGNLQSVVVPESVTTIGDIAFNWNGLTEMEFKGSVPSPLGNYVLEGNSFMAESIKVTQSQLDAYRSNAGSFYVEPEVFYSTPTPALYDPSWYPHAPEIKQPDVTAEKYFKFEWNDSLNGWTIIDYLNVTDKSVVIPGYRADGNPIVAISSGSGAFEGDELVSVVFPNTIKTIGDYSFYGNYLTTLELPEGLTYIGASPFQDNNLTSLSFPSSLTWIGEGAFTDNQLSYVDIPSTVEQVEGWAFSDNQLTSINMASSSTNYGEGVFYSNLLTTVSLPEGMTALPISMFDSNLIGSVTLPDSLKTIGTGAFYKNKLTSITIPSGVTLVDTGAFEGNLLTSVTISNTETAIGHWAFKDNRITTLSMPADMSSIDYAAFNGNLLSEANAYIYSGTGASKVLVSYGGNKTSVVIPAGTKAIGAGSFAYTDLVSVSIPDSVTSIGDMAFSSNSLTSLTLPSSVSTIGAQAFSSNQLGMLVIPSSVTTIGDNAFYFNQLTSVTFEGAKPTTLGTSIFTYNNGLVLGTVKVPSAYLAAYRTVYGTKLGLSSSNVVVAY